MSKEEKRAKFTRLANNRVNIVIDKLRLIGNLSDKRYYDYTDQDVKAIINSIQKEFSSVKNRFEKNKKSIDSKFHIE